MKPAPFAYARAATRGEALEMLAATPDDAKVISGGQSLVPMMNFRLARPEILIDINAIADLRGVSSDGVRRTIGATTLHHTLERGTAHDPLTRLLREAARHVGHLPIRTRGTFGGSLAHCDPASEWCVIARLLDAEMTLEQLGGSRTVDAVDFFVSIFTPGIADDELLTSIALPELGDGHRVGFAEYARRSGDFAVVIAATDLDVVDQRVVSARVCLGGVASVPVRAHAAEHLLVGADWTDDLDVNESVIAGAAAAAVDGLNPVSDSNGDADYRRDLVRTLVSRALRSCTPRYEGQK